MKLADIVLCATTLALTNAFGTAFQTTTPALATVSPPANSSAAATDKQISAYEEKFF